MDIFIPKYFVFMLLVWTVTIYVSTQNFYDLNDLEMENKYLLRLHNKLKREFRSSKRKITIGKDEVRVWNSYGMNKVMKCDVKCVMTSSKSGEIHGFIHEMRVAVRPPPDEKNTVYLMMEGEHYYHIDTTGWTVENSYRWTSPILKPYFEWHLWKKLRYPKVKRSAIDGVSFIARNCKSKNNREGVVKQLIKFGIRVDSLSSCMNNMKKSTDDKKKLMGMYKFHAAFENGNTKDYVTEKVYGALQSGTLPIYMGAPNIKDFVPKGSIINVHEFSSIKALSQHILQCIQNETLYNSYHTWRNRPLNKEFVERFQFTVDTTECRTCRWIYAKRHKYKWNITKQHFIP
jgi:hypothetical protein